MTELKAEILDVSMPELSSIISDAVCLVDGMGYLTALARTKLNGHLEYSERNLIEKLFQTDTMRIQRFHEMWTVDVRVAVAS